MNPQYLTKDFELVIYHSDGLKIWCKTIYFHKTGCGKIAVKAASNCYSQINPSTQYAATNHPTTLNKIQHMIGAYPQSKRKTQKLKAQRKPWKTNCLWNKRLLTASKSIS